MMSFNSCIVTNHNKISIVREYEFLHIFLRILNIPEFYFYYLFQFIIIIIFFLNSPSVL